MMTIPEPPVDTALSGDTPKVNLLIIYSVLLYIDFTMKSMSPFTGQKMPCKDIFFFS